MKGINKMKTRTNLESSSRPHLASLVLLLATVSLLAFAPPAARASTETPFHANFITQFETVLEFPVLHVRVNGQGQATHMGKTTAFTDDQIANLVDGSGSATYTLTAANSQRRHPYPGVGCSTWWQHQRSGRSYFLRRLHRHGWHWPLLLNVNHRVARPAEKSRVADCVRGVEIARGASWSFIDFSAGKFARIP